MGGEAHQADREIGNNAKAHAVRKWPNVTRTVSWMPMMSMSTTCAKDVDAAKPRSDQNISEMMQELLAAGELRAAQHHQQFQKNTLVGALRVWRPSLLSES